VSFQRDADLPPGPTEPALVQTLQWAWQPLAYLERARERFGPLWTSRLVGFPPLIHLSDPAAIREVFGGPTEQLRAGEANRVLEPILGSHSLFLLDGARHASERRLLVKPFQAGRLGSYQTRFREAALRCVESWPLDQPFCLWPRLQALTLDVILETVFGLETKQEREQFRREMTALLDGITHPLLLLRALQIELRGLTPWGRLRALQRGMDARIHDLIARRRAGAPADRDDILTLLLQARRDDGASLDDGELRDELVTLLVAGHDTVATSLAWMFHHLAHSPDALARTLAEVDRMRSEVGDSSWIEAVVKESLRLTPSLPIVARLLESDLTIGGVKLPRGSRAAPSIYLAHREPREWAEPARFRPERFLDSTISPFSYLPFGGGARRCIGMGFALLQMRVVAATILERVSVEPAPGRKIRAVRRGVVLTPSEGMPIVARRR